MNELALFAAVARAGSISGGARSLGISKAAASELTALPIFIDDKPNAGVLEIQVQRQSDSVACLVADLRTFDPHRKRAAFPDEGVDEFARR